MPTPTQTLPRFTLEPSSKPHLHDTSNTPLLFTDLSRSSAKPPTRSLHSSMFVFQPSNQPTIIPESPMGSIHIPREHATSTPRTGAVDPPPDATPMDSFQWKTPSHSHPSTPDRSLQTDIVPAMGDLQLKNSWDSSMWSSQTSDSSNLLSDSQTSLGDSRSSRRSSEATMKRDPLRRNYRNREHIYDKVHKSSVKRNQKELREEMTRELYRIKRKSGFTSGFTDFKGLLDYQRQLQNINLERAPVPSRSVPSLDYKTPPRTRRPKESSDDATVFLKRALDSAKATLNSPRPPKPFSPTLEQLRISHRAKDDDIERRIRPPLPPLPSKLPPADEAKVSELLRKRGVISKFAREQVSDQDISRLHPGQWLNDEIVNFYGAMILGRSEASKENPAPQANGKKLTKTKALLNIHYFSSFFWAKLVTEGYDKGRLAKWTKRIDLFSKDVVLIPINHGNAHWTAAAINFRNKRFESYDSMDMAKEKVFRTLREYINEEHKNKKKKDFDFTGWENWAPEHTPQQENGFDCGVFTCQFMETLSRGEEYFNFTQKDMPYLRRRMIWEIGNAKLRDEH
ncbi:hypothetical protein M413DRAFT_230782 [Hebeloma cylindrosporum]|uniref:Ubiquitin-like protease family profile domain-containing protein n=1 Tax=Hebeloma cylindrosporum TaxID=76867 RepID=A0A0C3CW74_HEBCY|nr:hypothetical protein M413DRAFT_230782 [Hebeloma cylindrosporum h7]